MRNSSAQLEKLFTATAKKDSHSPAPGHVLGSRFGMLTNQFGINRMFNFQKESEIGGSIYNHVP